MDERRVGRSARILNEWTTGLSYTVLDTKAGLGVETKLVLVSRESETGGRTPFTTEFSIGPSFQWWPLRQTHLDVAPLFGVTATSSIVKLFIVFGWEF